MRFAAAAPAARRPPRSSNIFSCFSPFPLVANVFPDIRRQDRQNEKPSDHIVLRVAGDISKPHYVAEVQYVEDRQADVGESALTAKKADADEKRHRDDVELERIGHGAADRAEARGKENF